MKSSLRSSTVGDATGFESSGGSNFNLFNAFLKVGSRSAKAQLNSLVVDGLTAKQTLPILHGRSMHDNDQKANNGVDDHQTVVVRTVNTFF